MRHLQQLASKSLSWCLALLFLGALSSSAMASDSQKMIGLDHEDRIPGQYIVVMKEQAGFTTLNRLDRINEFRKSLRKMVRVRVQKTFKRLIPALVIEASEEDARQIAQSEDVAFVEADRIVSINGIQENATWGLDRIDSKSGLDSEYNYTLTGDGVHAYIIDTGVLSSHEEFEGRMGEGFSSINDGRGSDDCQGHGTHVAGTVGGTKYGVAKNVIIHGVRVLGCNGSGTNSGVIAGVEWVAENAEYPAVANMSLGGGASAALDQAVEKAIDAGISFVVAAGNSNADACRTSPARTPGAITVGATAKGDSRSSFSNYGKCLDIFAPGSSITSASIRGNTSTATHSGTSMASPHVAGAVALILENDSSLSPEEVADLLIAHSTKKAISNVGNGSPNTFLFTGTLDEAPEPGPEPEPEPDCPECTVFEGELSGSGDQLIFGEGSYSAGQLSATLIADGQDFDLYLERKGWFTWRKVAESSGPYAVEEITADISSGTYRWRVVSASGAGDFKLLVK